MPAAYERGSYARRRGMRRDARRRVADVRRRSDVPVIDEVLDCGLALHDWSSVGWTGSGAIPSGIAARHAVASRTDGLYVFIDVQGLAARSIVVDPMTVFCGDCGQDAQRPFGCNGDRPDSRSVRARVVS